MRGRRAVSLACAIAGGAALILVAGRAPCAQTTAAGSASPAADAGDMAPPVMDNQIFAHLLLRQFEGRANGRETEFRWDGEGWIGTDTNKLWLKSEGFVEHGAARDGDTEALYDRPIPFLKYFDWQAGVRYDLDSAPGRTWGALGVEGLAPYFFEFEPTFYFSSGGRVAGRLMASYDLLLTQRLILQPEIEMNFYSRGEPARGVGSGLSELDTGLRLRYEISRKFAPYVGFAYTQTFGNAARLTRAEGGIVHDPRFVFGIRWWY